MFLAGVTVDTSRLRAESLFASLDDGGDASMFTIPAKTDVWLTLFMMSGDPGSARMSLVQGNTRSIIAVTNNKLSAEQFDIVIPALSVPAILTFTADSGFASATAILVYNR